MTVMDTDLCDNATLGILDKAETFVVRHKNGHICRVIPAIVPCNPIRDITRLSK